MKKMSNSEKDRKNVEPNISWYPGHMAKSKKQILEDLKLIDVVIEVLDARVPISSKNPEIEQYAKDKKKIIVLNKSDLADNNKTKEWMEFFKKRGVPAIAIEANVGKNIKQVIEAIKDQAKEIIQQNEQRGRKNYTIKVMVLGIPNVGKSTFINSLAGKNIANVENKPGVTRKNQWIQIGENIELLDTPGMLWPKLENQKIATHLSFINSIGQNAIDIETVAYRLLGFLKEEYPSRIEERYDIKIVNADGTLKETMEIREEIAKKTGCLLSGGNINEQRVSDIIIRDFRKGKLGNITIEKYNSKE